MATAIGSPDAPAPEVRISEHHSFDVLKSHGPLDLQTVRQWSHSMLCSEQASHRPASVRRSALRQKAAVYSLGELCGASVRKPV